MKSKYSHCHKYLKPDGSTGMITVHNYMVHMIMYINFDEKVTNISFLDDEPDGILPGYEDYNLKAKPDSEFVKLLVQWFSELDKYPEHLKLNYERVYYENKEITSDER